MSQTSSVPSNPPTDIRTAAETQRAVKRDEPSKLDEILRLKTDGEDIITWKRDITEVLQIFDVRSINSVAHPWLSRPLSDRISNQPLPDGCGYSSKHAGEAERCF